MIELRTLGGASLRKSDAADVLPGMQPKRLALLIYIAVTDGAPSRRRDALVAWFWPELDTSHARGSLRQALHFLRRSLADRLIATTGDDEVGVDPSVLWCDAVAFREHAERGQHDKALALYRGEFLHGFFAPDVAPEFEHWVEDTRVDLQRRAAASAWIICDSARDRGDHAATVAAARRATTLTPDDERAVARLITVLDEAGDRVGALGTHEALVARLRTEYDVEPSPETEALVRSVRARTKAGASDNVARPPAAPVEVPPPVAAPASLADARPRLAAPAGPANARRFRLPVIATFALLAIGGLTLLRSRRIDAPMTIAVLPFESEDADSSHAYVAEGMTDQLITDLAELGTLRVINRRTMMTYRGSKKTAAEVARELGADAVASGTLQYFGDTIRMTSQLVLGGEQAAAWAQSFEGTRGDLLRMQREVARAVATRTSRDLARARPAPLARVRPVDPEALDDYLKGRYLWNERRPASLLRAIGMFQQALHVDPTFALAYAGMADAYVQLGYGNTLAPGDAFPKAREAAQRALMLDSSLAEPHASLGFVHFYYDWDFPAAERELRRALAMRPSYATAHEWYGLYLAVMGRFADAKAEERRATELEPLSNAVMATSGFVSFYSGDLEQAATELRMALRIDSVFPLAHLYLGRVHQGSGALDSALAQYRMTGTLRSWGPTVAAEGHVLGTMGRRDEARAVLARLDSASRSGYVSAYAIALVQASIGDADHAFASLERGRAERTNWMVWLNRDARWAPIRADARFAALTRAIGLPR